MPYKSKTPCRHLSCAKLVDGGKYCGEHLKLHPEYVRSANKRGYDSRWQKASTAYLRENPLCVKCLKQRRYVQAMVVDHVTTHRRAPELFWDRNNWKPLCKACYDRKTEREDADRPTPIDVMFSGAPAPRQIRWGGAVIILKIVRCTDRCPPFCKFSRICKGGL